MSSMTKEGAKIATMHWFRKGLRLHDNPSLLSSIETAKKSSGGKFYPVYVLDGDCYQLRHCSALRGNYLIECIQDLDSSLRNLGSRLYVVSGDPKVVLPELWDKFNITHLSFESDESDEPYALQRDDAIKEEASKKDIVVQTYASETLHPLESYVTKVGGNAEKVPGTMGAFQTLFAHMGQVEKPLGAPTKDDFASINQATDCDNQWDGQMLPPSKPTDLPWPRNVSKSDVTPLWEAKDCKDLKPIVHGGESLALEQLRKSVSCRPSWVASFEKPKTSCTAVDKPSTTTLSPYLSLGCISPRTVWYALDESISRSPASCPKSKPPVSLHGQLLWRDFNNLIAHSANKQHPGSWGQMENNPYCRQIPWSNDKELVKSWSDGQTGYPWIDACMNQLKTEGWIHHLGRHGVACFLTRGDLWQSWEAGALHFESQLLDADYALNGFNWLWLSCSGFFYQYFRCYSPVTFQQKNDKSGQYIRKWIPALSRLPDKYIYEPWKAPIAVQKAAGIRIGIDYPKPIVDHKHVSKENMSKMSYAYDLHKEGEKKNKKKSSDDSGSGKKKKQKTTKQTKLKF